MDIRNKKISNDEFNSLRTEVLAQWPTGKDVNIEEMLIGKLDVEEAAMDEEMKFTFGGVELLDMFDEV